MPHSSSNKDLRDYRWKDIFSNLAQADAMKSLLISEIFIGLYTFILVYLNRQDFMGGISITITVHNMLGVTLGLLLVIRTNTAYDRWWEGRRLAGLIVSVIRNLALKLSSGLYNEETKIRKKYANYLVAYMYSIKEHLRKGVKFSELQMLDGETLLELKNSSHVPNRILSKMCQDLLILGENRKFDWGAFGNHFRSIDQLSEHLASCERIRHTPLPFAYRLHLKMFIGIYILTLPFGLMHELHYITIPAVMLIFFAMAGLELIGDEIEDPFGTDDNDIPMDRICKIVEQNVSDTLLFDIPKSYKEYPHN